MIKLKIKPIVFLFIFLVVLIKFNFTYAGEMPLKIDGGGSVPINSLWSTNSNGVFLHENEKTLVLYHYISGEVKYYPKSESGTLLISPQWIYINHFLRSGTMLEKYSHNLEAVYQYFPFVDENLADFVQKDHRLYRKTYGQTYTIEVYNERTQTITNLKNNTSGVDEREQVYENALYSVLKDGIYKTEVDAILPKTKCIMPIQSFVGQYTVYKNAIYFQKDGIVKYDIGSKKKEHMSELNPLVMAVYSDHLFVIDQKNRAFYQISPDKSVKKLADLKNIINPNSKKISILKNSNNSLVIIDSNTRIEVTFNGNESNIEYFIYSANTVESNLDAPEKVILESDFAYFVDGGTYKLDFNTSTIGKFSNYANGSIIKYKNYIYFDVNIPYDHNKPDAPNRAVNRVNMEFNEMTAVENWWDTWSLGAYKLYKVTNDHYFYVPKTRKDHIFTLKKENGIPLPPNEIGESEVDMFSGLEGAIEIDNSTIYTTEHNKIYAFDLADDSRRLLYTTESSLNGLYLYKGDLYFSGKGLYKLNLETNKVVKLTHDWVQHFTVMEDHIIYAPLYFKGKHYTYKMKLDGSDLYKVETPMGPDRENTFAIFTPKAVFFIDKVTNKVEKIKWLKN